MSLYRDSIHLDEVVSSDSPEPVLADAGAAQLNSLVDLVDRCRAHCSAAERRDYLTAISQQTQLLIGPAGSDARPQQADPWSHLRELADQMARLPLGSRRLDQCLGRMGFALRHGMEGTPPLPLMR